MWQKRYRTTHLQLPGRTHMKVAVRKADSTLRFGDTHAASPKTSAAANKNDWLSSD
jgi:hypothetical protein